MAERGRQRAEEYKLDGCGTGKNMLSSIIGQAVIASGYSSVHTTAMKLVRRIKGSWGRGTGGYRMTMLTRPAARGYPPEFSRQ